MATDPAFASTPVLGVALLGAAETDLQAPTTTSVVVTAGANGTMINEIVVHATKTATLVATTAAGIVYLFIYDGTTYHLYDTILVTAVIASTVAAPFRSIKQYQNLILKSGWSLRASQSIATNANLLKVECFGADL